MVGGRPSRTKTIRSDDMVATTRPSGTLSDELVSSENAAVSKPGGNLVLVWTYPFSTSNKIRDSDLALSDELIKSLSRESSPEFKHDLDEPTWKLTAADKLTASQILGLDDKFEKKSNSSGSETRPRFGII